MWKMQLVIKGKNKDWYKSIAELSALSPEALLVPINEKNYKQDKISNQPQSLRQCKQIDNTVRTIRSNKAHRYFK